MEQQSHFARLSLTDIPEAERAETLREQFGRTLMNVDFIPLTNRPDLETSIWHLPGVAVSQGHYTPHVVDSVLDPSLASDDFLLAWGYSPTEAVLEQDGIEVVGGAGQAYLLSCGRRMRSENSSRFSPRTIRVDRAMLAPLLPNADDSVMRSISPSNEALRLLNAYLDTVMVDGGPLCESVAFTVATHICDLVALAVGTNGDGAAMASRRGLDAARRIAVKQWIRAHLSDPCLRIDQAAAAQRMSPRAIQLLFQNEGTTFTAFLRAQRLALARRQLADPSLAHRRISDIAYSVGFGDLSHFNHAFRAAYGETPSDCRHDALSPDAQEPWLSL